MSDEIKKTLDAIGDAQAEHAKTLKEFVKSEEIKGHVEPILREKEEKLNNLLSDLEEKQAKQIQTLEDEVSKVKQSKGWQSGQAQEEAEQRKAALNKLLRKGLGMENSQPLSLDVLEKSEQELFSKSMISGANEQGGFVTVDAMSGAISLLEKERSPVRSLATVMSGSAPSWKQPVQTSRFAARRVGETQARTETATSDLGEQEIFAEELNAEPRVSQTMLDDANFDLVGYLNSQIADEFMITEGQEFVSGDGVKSFRGILTYDNGTSFGKLEQLTSKTSGVLEYDDFVDLDELLLPAFGNNAAFLMNRTTRAAARKIVDGQDRPLLQPDLPNGGLPTIFGKRIVDVPDMPNVSANNLAIAYGDFRRGYMVYDRMGIRVLRDPYTAKPFVIFSTTKRSGGDVINHQAIKLLKIKA
tara:strand:+ start:3273 stop:4517 length:1245 start_codon:yes stop_codon:yes gene_type:complete